MASGESAFSPCKSYKKHNRCMSDTIEHNKLDFSDRAKFLDKSL